GLMQLEPTTARQYAKRLGLTYSARLLTAPESNIRIGTAYLADQLQDFGKMYLVLAAYNAGDGRVHRWMQERSDLSQEDFIDDIPFYETQAYVRKILANAEDYRGLYGGAAGLQPGAQMPPSTQPADGSAANPTLNTQKKATPAPPAKPQPAAPTPARTPAKKRKRAA